MTIESALSKLQILVIEDGDEYLETLSRTVQGPAYTQVHNGRAACNHVAKHNVDVVYLDMRFDRIPRADLLGDVDQLAARYNGDEERAWRFLQNNQGLYILNALHQQGNADLPTILAYDFSHEQQRWHHLQQTYPQLSWVGDDVSPKEIRDRLCAVATHSRRR